MITWRKYRTGTVHAYDFPFMMRGQEIAALCSRAVINFNSLHGDKYDRLNVCRDCLRRKEKIQETSGDVDL